MYKEYQGYVSVIFQQSTRNWKSEKKVRKKEVPRFNFEWHEDETRNLRRLLHHVECYAWAGFEGIQTLLARDPNASACILHAYDGTPRARIAECTLLISALRESVRDSEFRVSPPKRWQHHHRKKKRSLKTTIFEDKRRQPTSYRVGIAYFW